MGVSLDAVFRAQKAILVIVTPFVLFGCSSRAFFQDNALTPVFNLYNRNFIVAAPTAFGNFVCGAPFFVLALAAIDPLVSTIAPGKGSGEGYTNFINGVYLVPATICGAATGLVFIPLSYVCPENAWVYGFKTAKNLSWKCEKEEPGLEIMWDIRPKDSVLEREIVVTSERVYRLQIVFVSGSGSM